MIPPSRVIGMSTTDPGCLTISASSCAPFGVVMDSTVTVKMRPSKTFRIECGTTGFSISFLFAFPPAGQPVEHVVQIGWQIGRELHPASVAGMREYQTRRVQERALQPLHRPDIARHAPMHAAVQRV